MATVIKVEKPKEIWREIRELINAHYKGSPKQPFMKEYPEIYSIYLQISAHKKEFRLEK